MNFLVLCQPFLLVYDGLPGPSKCRLGTTDFPVRRNSCREKYLEGCGKACQLAGFELTKH
jgi:hypothetical protein